MSRRLSIFSLAAVLWATVWGAVWLALGFVFKVVSDNLFYAWLMARLKERFGIEETDVIAVFSTYAIPLLASAVIIAIAYFLAMHRTKGPRRDPIEILYDPADHEQRYVVSSTAPYRLTDGSERLSQGTHYNIGIRNNTEDRTIEVRILAEGDHIIQLFDILRSPIKRTYKIDPCVTDFFYLFGAYRVDDEAKIEGADKDLQEHLNKRQRFTIRVRARDVKEAVAKFEYDPTKKPMLRKLRNVSR